MSTIIHDYRLKFLLIFLIINQTNLFLLSFTFINQQILTLVTFMFIYIQWYPHTLYNKTIITLALYILL
jgi:hypothetical protein